MAQPIKDNRIIIKGDEVRSKLLEGAQAVYESVTATFGPKGRNVLIEKPFGRPILTRDGVTVARDSYFSDRAKNIGAQMVLEASEASNRIAGDGTTATVALSYQLMQNGVQAIAAGVHPMDVKSTILQDQELLLGELDNLAKPTKPSQLKEVATVSSGDPLLGQLIAEAIEHVGPDGGLTTEKAPVNSVEREYVDGYYLQSGFQALQMGRKEMIEPAVLVISRRIASSTDIGEIMTRAAEARKMQPGRDPLKFLIIGEVDDAAYYHVVNLINAGQIDAVVLKTPPQYGEMGKRLLEDIAVYAGCDPITESVKSRDINLRHIGTVNKVVASKTDATLYADNSTERVQVRLAEIKDQLEAEAVDGIAEKLRERIAKLQGKIALFRIGGATDTAKEETEYRVEDAILATRAAYSHGVVPGGGVTLLELSKLSSLSDITRKALRSVFKQLLINANLPAELKLHEALEAPRGRGYNLRKDDKLVDMVQSGVLDPKLVVEQVIKNATEVAANALTTDVIIVFEDKKDEQPAT